MLAKLASNLVIPPLRAVMSDRKGSDFAGLSVAIITPFADGEVDYGRKSSEQGNVQFRRSLYWIRDLEAGAVVDATALRSVRPGYGLAPKYLEELLGRRLARPVSAKTPVRREDFEG